MPDQLDDLTTEQLREECSKRGIAFPCGNAVWMSTKRECLAALRNPCYVEAYRLGLIGKE